MLKRFIAWLRTWLLPGIYVRESVKMNHYPESGLVRPHRLQTSNSKHERQLRRLKRLQRREQ